MDDVIKSALLGCVLISLSSAALSTPGPQQLAWRVTPFAGYGSSMHFDAETGSDAQSDESNLWGIMVDKETNDPGQMGFLYSHQKSDLSPDTGEQLSIGYLHFTGALVYPDNMVHPYVGLGLGLSRLSAYDTETKPSMSLALGLQPKLSDNLAMMVELRGYGTFFNGDSQFICNPAVCAAHIQSDLIGQLQANVGMTFRF